MCPETSKKAEEKSFEIMTTQHLIETINQLQTEVENLKQELKKAKSIPSGKIGLAFIILSTSALIASVLINLYILAFIGLALAFWGALFFFVKPARYAQSSLLALTATSTYTTIDRIIKDLKFKGKSYYIPPSPQADSHEYSQGLKDPVVFIAGDSRGILPLEEAVESKFLLKNPHGIYITPPGLGLLKQFEKELRKDLSKLKLTELCKILPPLIVDNLQLAKNIEMQARDSHVYLKILNSTYMDLYITEEKLKSIYFLGCPLISAIACAVAKTSGKTVTVEGQKVSNDKQTVEVWYRIME
ncbi:MAG: hypothetical protein QXG76_00790 [Candidatus Bathyarchaeia archaeon]